MTNTKNTMTQAQALNFAIENFGAQMPADVLAKLNELYASKTKKYDRPATKSKERMMNESLVPAIVELIANAPEDELVNATWLNDHFDHFEVRSPQKARAIVEIAINDGLVEKYSQKGRTYYRVA